MADHYNENGRRRDPGCFARTTLTRALRHVVRQDDVGLVERTVTTYEFMPPFTGPAGGEVAAGLCSVALVTLIEIDETLAGYHSVRLLVDQYTSPMSGEPAVTAARVLAAQGQLLPLYARALHAAPGVPKAVDTCHRPAIFIL